MTDDVEKGTSSGSTGSLTETDQSGTEHTKDFEDVGVAPPNIDYEDPVSLERIRSAMSIASETVGAAVHPHDFKKSGEPLPAFGGGRPYPPVLPDREGYVVEFDGANDPDHPQNFSLAKKLRIMGILGYCTFTITFGSSIFSAGTEVIAKKFHVSNEVALLGTSLYVLGFGSGPLLWAPFSELSGRRLPILCGMFGFTVFQFAVATAYDIQTIMLGRFFGGFFGASCLAVVPATFADIVGNKFRGAAMTTFVAAVFCGPLLGPIIGSFIVASYLGWRWTAYLTGIMGGASLIGLVFLVEETYAPTVLVGKAAKLRRLTGIWGIQARQEQVEFDLKELVEKNFSRPLRMLVAEPILLLISIYSAFIYGILYLLLEAYPIIFVEGYGMSSTIGELPYIGLIIGQLIGCGIVLAFEPRQVRAMAANGGRVLPELRLVPTIIGSVVFPIGLFWLTWSGAYHEHVHWSVPTVAGLFVGCGIILIFLTSLTYIIESYLMFAASAMAANTMMRSFFAAGFPLFANQLFHNLHVQWAGTLLGCVAIVLLPVPVFFYLYGQRLRKISKYAPT
ncbi:major facilitator superfamily domain-containing protein [Lipomyces kononenkoae]|uniref:Major facilitator superfamily domain-containing protein n=1 Tax=Lipomyces kononenkoae TaxID=34357 RepID=A0ACC3T8C8_LIPKO